MSGGSSANSSWTILTPEETVAETLRPLLAEGTEHHGDSLTSAAGSGQNQPANCAESAEGPPVGGHLVSEETTAELSEDTSLEQHAVTDASAPASSEVSDSVVAGRDALVQSEGQPEGPSLLGPDPDSFSDSYAHISPSSPDEPSASPRHTETLGGAEFTQEEESLTQEGTLHPLNGAELPQEGEGSDLFPKSTDLWKQADSLVGEGTTEETGEEAEPELRRRRSLLAAMERIGRTEEEEEGEEEFQLPRQEEDDSGFSVNKCILCAVILLGLGTIFFSGVFMDPDEESDYGTVELKDAEAPGKQEWLNPEVPPLPVDADSSELLNKLAEGSEPISVLQAQLQKEELKVAQLQAEEGAKEQLRWEEMEKENSRLKKEMASLPVLQKENERMKRELEVVPALQKELETLRSTVTELKLSSAASEAAVKPITSPSSGQSENNAQGSAGSTERQPKKPGDDQREKRKDVKEDTIDVAEKKERKGRDKSEWKEGEKRERKDGGKTEWKQGKHEQGKFDKEKYKEVKQKRQGDETKQWREKEGKKEKASRGDEGKQRKDKEGKKEWIEKSERKGRKEEKDWKKASHENGKEGKQWRGKEEKKDWKVGKDREGKRKEEWTAEKEWKKGKDGFEESGKEKWEKKDWKEKVEKKEWKKKEGDLKSKDGKDRSKEGKGKGERKQWEESNNHGKERKGKNEKKSKNGKDDEEWRKKDERKQWEKKEESWKSGGERDKKHSGDWKKDKSSSHHHKDEHKSKVGHDHKEEHLWGDGKLPHTHGRPSLEQPEYWAQQRRRLQHNPKPTQQCDSLETCAQTEGLLPVPFPEFEAILLTYLAKAEGAGVDESKREELKKLAAEFFRDGVFVHDQTSFQEFVEDLADILEDMVEGDDDDDDDEGEEDEDSALEEEMEEFEREVMKKFSVPGPVETEERSKAEWRMERGRG